jgi:hypothetical protein
VVEDDCGLDAESKWRDVRTDPDARKGSLVSGAGGFDGVFLAAPEGRRFRGCRDEKGRVRGVYRTIFV